MSAPLAEIVIVNKSTVLTDAEITAVLPAIQAQVDEDFMPIWHARAKLSFVGAGHHVARDDWPLYIMDHTNQPGALGYHQDSHGRVSGRVFAADDKTYGVSWTVDLTHELLEMLADPTTNTIIEMPDGRSCLQEVCDAVEDDAVAYTKNGVLVSNFVLPSYFYKGEGHKYDFRGKLHGPAPALTPGGYLGIYDPATGQWTQVTAHLADGRTSPRSRRHGRTEWHASESAHKPFLQAAAAE